MKNNKCYIQRKHPLLNRITHTATTILVSLNICLLIQPAQGGHCFLSKSISNREDKTDKPIRQQRDTIDSEILIFDPHYNYGYVPYYNLTDCQGSSIVEPEMIEICAGSSVKLKALNFNTYQWSPATGLNNPTSASPTATPLVTTTYVVTGYREGTNLITNGDFEAGNSAFLSQYNYNPVNIGVNGDYAITDNVINVHPLGFPCHDHTYGTGLLMAVNGGPIPNTTVWQQEVSVTPFTTYRFSAWVTNWSGIQSNLARLQFSINGELLGPVFQTLPQQCEWKQFFIEWNSDDQTTADIRLINQNLTVIGNDFGLDDIDFRSICEAMDTVTIIVDTIYHKHNVINICEGDSAWVSGHFVMAQGIYIDTIPGGLSCDTIDITELNVSPSHLIEQQYTICEGDTLQLGAVHYYSEGFYRDTLTSVSGCDSIISTEIIVDTIDVTQLYFEFCEGDSVLVEGKLYKETGIYTDTLQTISGCDSILIISILVSPEYEELLSFRICEGDSIKIGVQVLTQTGNYTIEFSSLHGCDSTIHISLEVFSNNSFYQLKEICEGDSIQVGNSIYNTAGLFMDTLQNVNGCDSIIETEVILHPVAQSQLVISICEGDSVYFEGAQISTPGIYMDTLVSAKGCDSIVTLIVDVTPRYSYDQAFEVCDGEFIVVGTNVYDQSGLYVDTLTSILGCDSIIHTMMQVKSVPVVSISASICHGETLAVGNSLYALTGTYIDTLLTATGCDSIVLLELNVRDTSLVYQSLDICPGDSVTVGGMLLTAPGQYQIILENKHDCDSTIVVSVRHLPASMCRDIHCKMYVPNVFSPNGDGINDLFPIFTSTVSLKSLSIYDRWGGLLYYQESEYLYWDGSVINKPDAGPGVYVWVVEGICGNGDTIRESGDVTLIK